MAPRSKPTVGLELGVSVKRRFDSKGSKAAEHTSNFGSTYLE